jgi:hypothetical protein
MAIRKVSDNAYFVTDAFSYYAQIGRYDPLIANRTLISPIMMEEEEIEEVFVLEGTVDLDKLRSQMPSHEVMIDHLTPRNQDLLALARHFPPPPAWLEGEEECPF